MNKRRMEVRVGEMGERKREGRRKERKKGKDGEREEASKGKVREEEGKRSWREGGGRKEESKGWELEGEENQAEKKGGKLLGAWRKVRWREREGGKGEREPEVDRWKERGSKVASVSLLRTISGNCNVKLEASFQLPLQELAVYHGKQKLESIKQANAGLCSNDYDNTGGGAHRKSGRVEA